MGIIISCTSLEKLQHPSPRKVAVWWVRVTFRLCDAHCGSLFSVWLHLWGEGNKVWETGAEFYPFYPLFLLLRIRNCKMKYIGRVSDGYSFIIEEAWI